MTERPILVLGATGGQRGAVAAALLGREALVRACRAAHLSWLVTL
jgi:uncharacterized protein YbjT (DUF2867 family)